LTTLIPDWNSTFTCSLKQYTRIEVLVKNNITGYDIADAMLSTRLLFSKVKHKKNDVDYWVWCLKNLFVSMEYIDIYKLIENLFSLSAYI